MRNKRYWPWHRYADGSLAPLVCNVRLALRLEAGWATAFCLSYPSHVPIWWGTRKPVTHEDHLRIWRWMLDHGMPTIRLEHVYAAVFMEALSALRESE